MIVVKAFFLFFTEEKESIETRKGSPLPPISKSPPPGKAVLPNVPITLIMGESARSKLTYYEIMIIIFRK